jgi:tetratricopeptide (TPR) repeat protein
MSAARSDDGSGSLALPAAAAGLAAAVAAAFGSSLRAPFLWDDYLLVVGNPGVERLDLAHLRWMFTTFYQSAYQPLGWLAIACVRAAAGLSSVAHHSASLAAHWLAAFAFFLFARALFGRARAARAGFGAFAAALLFAVHPLQSFTAGWITELPDSLATAAFLASLTVYLGKDSRRRLPLCWGLFLVSLLFRWKGIALPLALTLLDVWPLKRAPLERWREKIPFWLLAAAALAVNGAAKLGVDARLAPHPVFIARGLELFLWLLAWPREILPLYALQDPDTLGVPAALALGLAASAAGWLWLERRRRPALIASAVFFAAALAPPLLSSRHGVLVVFPHYSYLAALPFFALAAEGLRRLRAAGAVVLLACVAGAWTLESARQTAFRRDEAVFWTRALALDRGSLMAYTNLSDALFRAGRFNEAYYYLSAQLVQNPGDEDARAHLELLARQDSGLKPDLVDFWTAAAGDLVAAGRPRDALILCGRALRLRPRDSKAHAAAARALEALGEPRRALDHRRAS